MCTANGGQTTLEGSERVKTLGIEIRTSLHTGEIEVRDDDISGLAVHVAARIMDHADANEVLVSKIVTDLDAGSESFDFNQRGEHNLKGLSGDWQLLSAELNQPIFASFLAVS